MNLEPLNIRYLISRVTICCCRRRSWSTLKTAKKSFRRSKLESDLGEERRSTQNVRKTLKLVEQSSVPFFMPTHFVAHEKVRVLGHDTAIWSWSLRSGNGSVIKAGGTVSFLSIRNTLLLDIFSIRFFPGPVITLLCGPVSPFLLLLIRSLCTKCSPGYFVGVTRWWSVDSWPTLEGTYFRHSWK